MGLGINWATLCCVNISFSDGLWAIIGAIVGAFITGAITLKSQKNQFEHEKAMFRMKNISVESAKEMLEGMLFHKKHLYRSLQALYDGLGGAFSKDEIKKILIEFAKSTKREGQTGEWWYHKDRESEHLERVKNK